MARPKARLTNGELEILNVFWAADKCSVRDLHDALSARRPIALTTVATRVMRMEAKNLLESVDDRRPKVYKATVERDQTAGNMVGDVLERVLGGNSFRSILQLWAKTASKSEIDAVRDQLNQIK